MEKKLVSIILPIYNGEKYIYQAIESVLNQTYANFELIIIDDGSTDSSKTIISSFDDQRIVLVSRENRGLIASLNQGIELSKGAYIARMDADDICYVDRLEQQINFFKTHPNIGTLFSGIEYINPDGQVFDKNIAGKSYLLEPVELLFGCPVCHPTAVFNMQTLSKTDIQYDQSYNKTEDFELWTRLVTISDIGVLAKPLLQYRVHPGSITSLGNAEQRHTAIKALRANLTGNVSDYISNQISVLFNNTEARYSVFKTLKAITVVFVQLKKINKTFSRMKYVKKSVRLLHAIVSLRLKTKTALR